MIAAQIVNGNVGRDAALDALILFAVLFALWLSAAIVVGVVRDRRTHHLGRDQAINAARDEWIKLAEKSR